MSREKFLNTVLAILVLVPAIYQTVSIVFPSEAEDPFPESMVTEDASPSLDSDLTPSVPHTIYFVAVLAVALLLLQETDAIETKYKWVWLPCLILLLPIASLALVFRVYRGKPIRIPKTLDEQRQILRERAAEIKNREGDI